MSGDCKISPFCLEQVVLLVMQSERLLLMGSSWPFRALSIAVGANKDQKWRGERALTLFKTEVDFQDVFLILSGLSGRPDDKAHMDRLSQFLIVSIRPAVGLVSHLFTEPSHNDLTKGVYS